MGDHVRFSRIETPGQDGSFRMILASEGEASDGHILDIEGGEVPERMPLLLAHQNDPTAQAGSVVDLRKDLKASPRLMRARGLIEMGGEGALAEIRRDVANMMQGHPMAVSIRWDEVEGHPPVPRVDLPSTHRHFVDAETETSWRKRNGLYYARWRAMEGSIVPLGADPKAIIGRSRSTAGPVSAFWRTVHNEMLAEQARADAALAAALAVLGDALGDARESGATEEQILHLFGRAEANLRAIAESILPALDPEPETPEPEERTPLPAPQPPVDPPAPRRVELIDPAQWVKRMSGHLDARDARLDEQFRKMLDQMRGRL